MRGSSVESVKQIVQRIIALRAEGKRITLLAVCPNSDAVLDAAIRVAAENSAPMLFAATLNQVDRDGGYTGWTPDAFVARMRELATQHQCASPLFPCLDHGGPWLKDAHTLAGLTLEETTRELKLSLTAALQAGYALLHIDPTVDRTLPHGQPPDVDVVVERTVELIAHAESDRERLGLPPVSYEVGTEEVHGGLADFDSFDRLVSGLQASLEEAGLAHAWPCFIVAKVGTDLHTTTFDPAVARRLYRRVFPLGSLIKGHYTDWVANPADYPAAGMGGANVGPEFTAAELSALYELCDREDALAQRTPGFVRSGFREALQTAVVDSKRWQKWLTPEESDHRFEELAPSRRKWLVATGARYVWTSPGVVDGRRRLHDHVRSEQLEPHEFVVGRIGKSIQKYVDAFNLSWTLSIGRL